jgi:hypothetical protein
VDVVPAEDVGHHRDEDPEERDPEEEDDHPPEDVEERGFRG